MTKDLKKILRYAQNDVVVIEKIGEEEYGGQL